MPSTAPPFLTPQRAPLVPWGRDVTTLCHRFGPRPAVATGEGTHSYDEVLAHAGGIAARLRAHGVAPGEPVISFLRNGVAAVSASYGMSLAGVAETALNAHLSPAELAHCVKVTGARHVVTDAASAPIFHALRCTVHRPQDCPPAPIDANARVRGDAFGRILFTSGTTGLPKAIVHSQFTRWLSTVLLRAHLPFLPDAPARILLMTPFSHGASLLTYAFLDHGASVHLMDGVHPAQVATLLRRGEVNAMFAPPTVLAKLIAAFGEARFEGLRCIFTGTATLTPQLYAKARAMFGPVVRVTYGKSEMLNPITVLPPADCEAYYGDPQPDQVSLGWPATGVEVRILDEDGRICPTGAAGEIAIRSPHLMVGQMDLQGYRPLEPGAWHATGDIGLMAPSGALHLVGRAHDVIKTGGHKVYPQEIELALESAVAPGSLAVVGLPSDYWGQVIVAAVEGGRAGWPQAVATAAEAIAKYKRPRAFVEMTLPRGAQDKVRRADIVAQLAHSHTLIDGPHPRLVAKTAPPNARS